MLLCAPSFSHQGPETAEVRIAQGLTAALLSKGVTDAKSLQQMVQRLDEMGKQAEGARLVARAWVDPAFRKLLEQDATEAARQLGIDASNANAPTKLTAVFNSDKVV